MAENVIIVLRMPIIIYSSTCVVALVIIIAVSHRKAVVGGHTGESGLWKLGTKKVGRQRRIV